MTLSAAWVRLHATRFPELPLDCGNDVDPGVIYSEDLRDWSDKATTPDQLRIELYVDRFDLRRKRILHIGIGNSGLAKRLSPRVGEIVGTTIDDPEIRLAEKLRLPNYHPLKQNKFRAEVGRAAGKFDFIIDNNPTSPCCCLRHLAALIDFYRSSLADGGQIVTDQEGLGWVPDSSNPRWSFGFEDWQAVGEVVNLSAFRISRSVYVLAPDRPAPPGTLPLMRHALRQLGQLPRKVAGTIIRAARRLAQADLTNR